MSSLCVFVVGPAGTGKTTLCANLYEYLQNINQETYYVNLDPSAKVKIPCAFDLTDYITTDEVMDEFKFGPNGGLIHCFKELIDSIDELDIFEFPGNSIILFDCPGQIELYIHYDYIKTLINRYQNLDFTCCLMYLLESHYINNQEKILSACISCLSAFSLFAIPQLNIITKMDLLVLKDDENEDDLLEKYYSFIDTYLDFEKLRSQLENTSTKKLTQLSLKLLDIIDDFGLLDFIPFDCKKETNISQHLFLKICEYTHFGEDNDIKSDNSVDYSSYEDEQGI